MALADNRSQPSKALDDTLSHVDRVLQSTTARVKSSTQWAASQASNTLDRAVTPEQRRQLSRRTESFVNENPKLAAFLAANLVLTGIPVLVFLTFSASIFFFSVVTGLFLGLISALVFTATSVGLALFVLVPTIFFTTIAAVLLFTWGLVAFTVLQWVSKSRRSGTHQVNGTPKQPKRISDTYGTTEKQNSNEQILRFSESKHNNRSFDFSSDKELPAKIKENAPDGSIKEKVPTAHTTGMVAS